MSVGERIPVSWYANSSALELSSIIEISTALFCSGAEQRCHEYYNVTELICLVIQL